MLQQTIVKQSIIIHTKQVTQRLNGISSFTSKFYVRNYCIYDSIRRKKISQLITESTVRC